MVNKIFSKRMLNGQSLGRSNVSDTFEPFVLVFFFKSHAHPDLDRSFQGILTKAAEEGCSSLPHYLIDCEEAKPPVDSERNTTHTRDHFFSYSPKVVQS